MWIRNTASLYTYSLGLGTSALWAEIQDPGGQDSTLPSSCTEQQHSPLLLYRATVLSPPSVQSNSTLPSLCTEQQHSIHLLYRATAVRSLALRLPLDLILPGWPRAATVDSQVGQLILSGISTIHGCPPLEVIAVKKNHIFSTLHQSTIT